jgi:deazaflavin-dependent oxidoreductase (nitroreductase family)
MGDSKMTQYSGEEWLRQGFRYFNHFMVLIWHMGLGRWINCYPPLFGRIMVITHKGRRTGIRRRTPVNYARMEDGAIYCLAGFGEGSDWYRNILVNPRVELWLPDGWWSGTAEELADIDPGERIRIIRQVLINSGFASYVAGINPHRMSDEEIATATQSYRLMRIHIERALSGEDGPGDMVWLWPIIIVALLPLLLISTIRRSKKGRKN